MDENSKTYLSFLTFTQKKYNYIHFYTHYQQNHDFTGRCNPITVLFSFFVATYGHIASEKKADKKALLLPPQNLQ